MKALIIYESTHHGNTEKIAKVMSEVLNAKMVKTKDVDTDSLDNYDLIGFGSGIYFGKLHKNIMNYIDNMEELLNKKAFVFSTSGQGREKDNNSAIEKLKEKNFEVIGSFACKGYDTYGPLKLVGGIAKGRPNEMDLEKAREFVRNIIIK